MKLVYQQVHAEAGAFRAKTRTAGGAAARLARIIPEGGAHRHSMAAQPKSERKSHPVEGYLRESFD
ncbi:MAG: hypothetical protein WAV20_25520 [Blastocatellia bacterium]